MNEHGDFMPVQLSPEQEKNSEHASRACASLKCTLPQRLHKGRCRNACADYGRTGKLVSLGTGDSIVTHSTTLLCTTAMHLQKIKMLQTVGHWRGEPANCSPAEIPAYMGCVHDINSQPANPSFRRNTARAFGAPNAHVWGAAGRRLPLLLQSLPPGALSQHHGYCSPSQIFSG